MAMNRAAFARELEEGLNTVFGLEYASHPEEWRRIYEVVSSKKAFEEDQLVTGFGGAQVKAEGDSVAFDEGSEAWTARYQHETIALAFRVTEEAQEDNLYMSMGAKYSKALARSLQHTKEVKGAYVLNNATAAGVTYGDGKPLLSTAHPLTGGGTASNKLSTAADFSETSLEDILIQMRKAVDDRGIPIALRATDVIIPPDLEYTACRILDSTQRPGTADNDVNAINKKSIFGRNPAVITRLTDADQWFIRTDCPDGLKHFNRKGVVKKMTDDFQTGDFLYKARERYVFGLTDWRGIFGSEGAA